MDIILLEDVDKVGEQFEIVTVKDGYGRNYLIPQKLAIIANRTNLARLSDFRNRQNKKEANVIAEAQVIADQLKGQVLKIGAKAGTSGKIFGSVTNIQIAQAMAEQLKIEVDRKKIDIDTEVKELGSYTATLNLHKAVAATISFEVVRD